MGVGSERRREGERRRETRKGEERRGEEERRFWGTGKVFLGSKILYVIAFNLPQRVGTLPGLEKVGCSSK